jgi:NADPH:quinone reductase
MVTVYKSSVIDAPIVEVWACIRDFKNLYWKHDDAESHIEEDQPSDKIGCIRHSSLQSGGHLREQLLALSDYHCSVLRDPRQPAGRCELRLHAEAQADHRGQPRLHRMERRLRLCAGREAELAHVIGVAVLERGFDALKTIMARRSQ